MKTLINLALAPFAATALIFAAAPSPAAAAPTLEEIPIRELFGAYQAICMANPGDPAAQAKTAAAAPWGFKQVDDDGRGTVTYENGRLSMRLAEREGFHICMTLAKLAPDITENDAIDTVKPVLGKPELVTKDGVVSWSSKAGDTDLNHVFVHAKIGEGKNAATLAVFSLASR